MKIIYIVSSLMRINYFPKKKNKGEMNWSKLLE